MNAHIINRPDGDIVFIRDGEVFASSKGVAERFGKRHADVLRAVSELDCSSNFLKRNFAFSTYRPDGAKRDYPCANMTRDGFTFLVMGFTGHDAAIWKERYIEAFNRMEVELRSEPSRIDLRNPAQLARITAQLIEINGELENRLHVAEMSRDHLLDLASGFDRDFSHKKEPLTERDAYIWLLAHGRRSRNGTIHMSQVELQHQWLWRSKKRVQDFLKRLEADGYITVRCKPRQKSLIEVHGAIQ
jgi:Rha family phage regulatory protein